MNVDLATVAYHRLSELISGGEWLRGGRLPAEDVLAREVGVSRPILRRALSTLRDEGRIVSRRGSGNFVTPSNSPAPARWPSLDVRNLLELEQCLRFRLVLESGIAAEAAERADSAALDRIEKANGQLGQSLPDGSLFEVDFAFHLSLAEATGNPFFVQAMMGIKSQIRLAYEVGRKMRAVPLNETSRRVTGEHNDILAAIRAGDDEAARQAMSAHLGAGIRRLFGQEA